jgi:thiamine kinase-like enzyme
VKAVDLSADQVKSIFSALLAAEIRSLEQIRGGRNTRVYAIRGECDRQYCGKMYFRQGGDQRDRLRAEFRGLRFLWDNGVRRVPEPIASDATRNAAVYEFVEGRRLDAHEITREHIDVAVRFLSELKNLCTMEGCETLPPASEAVFSVLELIENIFGRLRRLQAAASQADADSAFALFVNQRFPAVFNQVKDWAERRMPQDTSLDDHIRDECKTLSPSDFGFHNALLRPNGELVFLDFEYFGWDDPAKTIADFLLHPAVELGMQLKRFFFGRMIETFHRDEGLADRVETMYPLFGLKWCMILLNEFVPEHLDRRGFSGQRTANVAGLRTEQLAKSQRMLQKVLDEYENFTYRIG